MEEIIIEKEKVEFINENKESLITHFASVKYMLFMILTSDEKLQNMQEYNQLLSVINNDCVKSSPYVESSEIIYYLVSFLDKVNIGDNEQSVYRNRLYNYLDYFKKESKNFGIRKSA